MFTLIFQALPYFSATVKSTKFMEQIVMKILPHYYLLPELTGQEVSVHMYCTLVLYCITGFVLG